MTTEPTYTMDEVYEEAKKFAAKNNLNITSKKGLPKGHCGDAERCVLANLFGGEVLTLEFYSNKFGVRPKEVLSFAIPFDSVILDQFIIDFDRGFYPELTLSQS